MKNYPICKDLMLSRERKHVLSLSLLMSYHYVKLALFQQCAPTLVLVIDYDKGIEKLSFPIAEWKI